MLKDEVAPLSEKAMNSPTPQKAHQAEQVSSGLSLIELQTGLGPGDRWGHSQDTPAALNPAPCHKAGDVYLHFPLSLTLFSSPWVSTFGFLSFSPFPPGFRISGRWQAEKDTSSLLSPTTDPHSQLAAKQGLLIVLVTFLAIGPQWDGWRPHTMRLGSCSCRGTKTTIMVEILTVNLSSTSLMSPVSLSY